jgi:membrane fusion protein, multidrug efflux system
LTLFALASVGLSAWFIVSRGGDSGREAQAAVDQNQRQEGYPQTVPIFAVTAAAKDFSIIVRGIGTVEASNTVNVKSRVDGHILRVAFTEGQIVRAGDLLVQIDPRPLPVQLAQAEANKAKDQANLENAQRDLARLEVLVKNTNGANAHSSGWSGLTKGC